MDFGQSANLDSGDATSRLELAKHLFDAIAAALADTVASVAQGASVNGGLAPLAGLGQMSIDGDVRRDVALAQVMHETSRLSDGGPHPTWVPICTDGYGAAVTTIFAARPAKAISICKFNGPASQQWTTLRLRRAELRIQLLEPRVAKNEDSPAKLAILQEWDFWANEHPEAASLSGSIRFFEHLKNRRPDLLMDFRASGDKWKTVRSWLRAARKVKD